MRIGRPKLPVASVRSRLFGVRVTADEHRLLHKAGGEKPSTWARDVLLKAAKRLT